MRNMGRIFYLDAANGNDKNNGITPDEALKSLEAANRIVFGEGDKLLLKCGCVWKGMLCLHGDGDRFNFAQVGVYGDGEAPLIDGNGAYAAILLDGVSYWKVKGLRICNHSGERRVRQGICISAKPEGITAGIEISDCEIFEVDGENRRAMPAYQSMYWNGAVYVTFPGRTSAQDHLHDIVISNNYIHDVRTSGIRVNQQEDFINDIHHTHVVVRGNRIERTGSDGIIVANCISPLIDSNVCFDVGALGTLEDTQLIAGIWICATRDALIQRNEVARTRMFENDGTAFDTDWGTAGTTVFQYNYSHDNEGGFWLDCMKLNHNRDCEKTILRYNISMRDGRGIAVYDQGILAEWYGNLFYNENPIQICCFDEGENFHFANNVFCVPKETEWQKARYEDNIVNDEKWRELLQDEIRNSNWRDVVMEKLCKLVGVKR